jgi:hypothetical protein
MIAPLDVDEIPLKDHLVLCRLGSGNVSRREVEDAAHAYRVLLSAIKANCANELNVTTLADRVSAQSLRWLSDAVYDSFGKKCASDTLRHLKKAAAYIRPLPDLSLIDSERRRVSRLPTRTVIRYNIQKDDRIELSEVPPQLLYLFDQIDDARREITDEPFAKIDRWKKVILNYLAILRDAGVDIASLTRETVLTSDHLDIYRNCKCGGKDRLTAQRKLSELKSALRIEGFDPVFDGAFAHYRERLFLRAEPDSATPAKELKLLEKALARLAHKRKKDEPGRVSPAAQKRMKEALEAFHRAIRNADPDLWQTNFRTRDLDTAIYHYEMTMQHCLTSTVVTRLKLLKSVYRRIGLDASQLRGLSSRISELKRGIERKAVEMPDGVTPHDVKNAGLKLVNEASERLRALVKTKYPYRCIRTLAERYRDGVLFLIYSRIALRVANMAILLLGTYIIRKDNWAISIPKQFVGKTGEAIYQDLPVWLTPILDEYDAKIRPLISKIIPGLNDNVFWISSQGRSLCISSFQKIVERRSLQELDVRIHCHLLRTIDASFTLEHAPDDLKQGTVRLRQLDPRTTRTYYQTAASVERTSASFPGVKRNDAGLPDLPSNINVNRRFGF